MGFTCFGEMIQLVFLRVGLINGYLNRNYLRTYIIRNVFNVCVI